MSRGYSCLLGLARHHLGDRTAANRQLSNLVQSLDYKNPERKDFWDALMVVAEAELKEARKQDEVDRARLRGMREPDQDAREDRSVQAAVDMDVQIFLTGEARMSSLPGARQQALLVD